MRNILIFSLLIAVSESKHFSVCHFVDQLQKHGVPEWQVPTLTCIALWESRLNSRHFDLDNGKHGIFGIVEDNWCSPNEYPGGECETTCSSFRDDHLGDDIDCALLIYQDSKKATGVGYSAWNVYWSHCAWVNTKYVEKCY
ncbi:hypothetical protein JTB14_013197 [Gonioctena quinquepunctata]|nr:hypothetical protein JTB14_013197 [Gonioctena quinquepunctata]